MMRILWPLLDPHITYVASMSSGLTSKHGPLLISQKPGSWESLSGFRVPGVPGAALANAGSGGCAPAAVLSRRLETERAVPHL